MLVVFQDGVNTRGTLLDYRLLIRHNTSDEVAIRLL